MQAKKGAPATARKPTKEGTPALAGCQQEKYINMETCNKWDTCNCRATNYSRDANSRDTINIRNAAVRQHQMRGRIETTGTPATATEGLRRDTSK